MSETLNSLILGHWASNRGAAVVGPDGSWSGEELIERALAAAAWLDGLGLAEGAAVPALLDESGPAVALAVGAALSGRALAPLGTRLPAHQVAPAVRDLGAPVLIAQPWLRAAADDVAALAGARVHLVGGPPGSGAALVRGGPSDIGAIIHTSGTTGQPRPVRMRHDRLVARTRIYAEAIELEPGDRYFSASPFYHVAGMGMALVALGAGVTVLPCPGFSLPEWERLKQLRPTHAQLVPTMIDMLLAAGRFDARLRVQQYGASPIHPDTLAAAMAAAPATRLIQIFGQTEVSPVTALSHEDHRRAAAGELRLLASVGTALRGVGLGIEHPDAQGIGELVVRAPHAMDVDPDGLRRTGDLAAIDADGYVFLHGRRNDRIVRGGENIYPIEIETVLGSHPGVAEACVVGVPDRRWGEVVKAVVVPSGGATLDAAELQAWVRDRLAHFKVPATVEFVDVLPRTPSGKVLRRALR